MVGLGDEMIKSQVDEFGNFYPAYGFKNDKEYQKVQPHDAVQILYGMRANATNKPLIHSNVYKYLSSGQVRFLIKEQEAKSRLLGKKKGQKMTVEERVKELMPYEMTTSLFLEMANLRLKKTAGSDIVLEQINSRVHDDKYMSFAYGLWRLHEREDEEMKRARRFNHNIKQMVFFTPEC